MPRLPSQGFCASRQEAKAEFAKTWRAWLLGPLQTRPIKVRNVTQDIHRAHRGEQFYTDPRSVEASNAVSHGSLTDGG
jgi:hypothetical protein